MRQIHFLYHRAQAAHGVDGAPNCGEDVSISEIEVEGAPHAESNVSQVSAQGRTVVRYRLRGGSWVPGIRARHRLQHHGSVADRARHWARMIEAPAERNDPCSA